MVWPRPVLAEESHPSTPRIATENTENTDPHPSPILCFLAPTPPADDPKNLGDGRGTSIRGWSGVSCFPWLHKIRRLRQHLPQFVNKHPGILERVVEWNRRGPDDVGFAKIHHDATLEQT